MSLPVAGQNWSLHICLTTQYYVKEGWWWLDPTCRWVDEEQQLLICLGTQSSPGSHRLFSQFSTLWSWSWSLSWSRSSSWSNGRQIMQQTNKLMKLKWPHYYLRWCSMMFYDVLWCSMMFYDVLWCSMMFYDVPRCSMMFYDDLWCFLLLSHLFKKGWNTWKQNKESHQLDSKLHNTNSFQNKIWWWWWS